MILKTILNMLLGGRPMMFQDFGFIDVVSDKPVNLYMDMFGRHWIANNRWGWFRVRVK